MLFTTIGVFAENKCDFAGVRSISLPWYHDQKNSNKFVYKYRVYRKPEFNKPTVVFIPGGPGQVSINNLIATDKLIPIDWGLILTDPRGVGCNDDKNILYPPVFFKTEYIATDILGAIIDSQIPISSIILYGASYGTVVATEIADIAARQGLESFKQIILEGTLGRSFIQKEYASEYETQWELYFSSLSEETKTALKNINTIITPSLLNSWSDFLQEYLLVGGFQNKGHILDYPISLLLSANGKEELVSQYLNSTIQSSTTLSNSDQLWANIWCGELNSEGDTWEPIFDTKASRLKVIQKQDNFRCHEVKQNSVYNASLKVIRENIIYFHGEADPAVPLWSGQYHFNNIQGSGYRILYIFPKMGHSPLRTLNMFNDVCGANVIQSVETNSATLNLIKDCGFTVNMKKRN
jgi:pimeloyl-ACP methyl ester carboxylesterase